MCGTESSSGMEHPVEYGVIGMPMKAVEEESNQQIVLVEFTDECYGSLCTVMRGDLTNNFTFGILEKVFHSLWLLPK